MVRTALERHSATKCARMKTGNLMNDLGKIQFRAVAAGTLGPRRAIGWIPLLWFTLVVCAPVLGRSAPSKLQLNSYLDRIIPVPHPLTSLLRAEQVQLELALTTAQIRDVEKAASEIDLPLWLLRDLPAKERNEAADPLIRQLANRLSQVLSAPQAERLNQIVWQAQGIEAVLEPEVTARLSLSAEQVGSIVTALHSFYDKIASLQRNTEIQPESRKVAYARKLRADAESNILAVLDSRQRHLLATLMGHPFDLSHVRGIVCRAPEFGAETWLNSSPLKMSDLKGKVTVIHFYAFGCGNCVRNLPHYNDWHKQFGPGGLQIVGIHTPETQRERDIEKVREKADEAGMHYPIVIDNERLCWDSWANHIWPSIYLVDKNGFVRYWWYGELNWQGAETEKLVRGRIEELLKEEH